MDIKPVKKRRKKTLTNSQVSERKQKISYTEQGNIVIKSDTRLANKSDKKNKRNKTALIDFLKRNVLMVSSLVFLSLLYLPASRFIDTTAQYQNLVRQSFSFDVILNDVSYMPQKLFVLLVQSGGFNGSLILKSLTFTFTLLVVYLFYKASANWLGRNAAVLSALLFLSSTWLIFSSQSISFSNIYLIFFPLIVFLNHLYTKDKSMVKVVLAASIFAVVLYSPGMVWPALGLIALVPLFMQKIIRKYNTEYIWVSLILIFALLVPLFVCLILKPDNFSSILVGEGSIAIYEFMQNLQSTFLAMFVNGLPDLNLWVVGTPVLNYITTLLFIFGIVSLYIDKNLRQHFNFLFVSLIFSVLTLTFVGLTALSLILPVVYLIAGFGIKFLLNSWYSIFPNNPVARNSGLALVVVVVMLASAYEITRYYIAWPRINSSASSLVSENIE